MNALYPVMVKQTNTICIVTPANSQLEANIKVMKGLSDKTLKIDTKKCKTSYEVSEISCIDLPDNKINN